MIKAILEFNLPEDQCEYTISTHAMDFALALNDVSQKLRDVLKYGHKYKSADEALEDIQKYLFDSLDGRNITLDMIE